MSTYRNSEGEWTVTPAEIWAEGASDNDAPDPDDWYERDGRNT